MKLFILVYNWVALLEAVFPQRFKFSNETTVPTVINHSAENLGSFPLRIHIRISRYDLHLTLNEVLLPPSFTSTHYVENGQKIITRGFRNCYYQGLVESFHHENVVFHNWNASLSTCNGIQGQFGSSKDGFIYIRPAGNSSSIEQEHLLYHNLQDQLVNRSDYHCKAIKELIRLPKANEVSGVTHGSSNAFYNLEIDIYNDFTQYTKHGSNIQALVAHTISIINRVDMLFFPLDVNVVLVGLSTWSNRDMIVFPADNSINEVLDNFNFYLKQQDMISDVTLLLSGRTYAKNALGVAFVTGACVRGYSGMVAGSGGRLVAGVAVTIAHEIGHTLGMDHDDKIEDTVCACADKTGYCIMESTLYFNVDFYSQWSSCSLNTFRHFAPFLTCLLDPPSTLVIHNHFCGNGVMEAGEECDCNGVENCTTFSCCNMTTCQFLESSTVCRPKGDDDCDLPDYCNGQTATCLSHHLEDGQICLNANSEQSYCVGSVCIVRDAQCKQFYGPNSMNAVDECYLQNSLGNIQGHCGIAILFPMFRPCSGVNYKCGLLHCEGGSFIGTVAEPVHHNRIQVRDGDGITHTCLSFTTLLNSSSQSQPGFVHYGTPCGISMACLNQLAFPACGFYLDLEPRNSQCPTDESGIKCSGTKRGRCSNLHLCVCNAGYYGVSCNCSDECLTGAHNCQQICIETDANFTCSCNPGYALASNGANCTDINECLVDNGGCAQNCTNTVGSFKCSCYDGYELVKNAQCRQKDINECLVDNGGCAQNCTNTVGSFKCSCYDGYELVKNSQCRQKDFSKCLVNNGGCDQICYNTVDSFICSCNPGYQLSINGLLCEDTNECLSKHNCQEICENTVGGFRCYCNLGYDLDSDGTTCIGCVESGRCAHSCYMGMCLCFEGFNLDSNNRTCSGTTTGGSNMVYTAMLASLSYVLVRIL